MVTKGEGSGWGWGRERGGWLNHCDVHLIIKNIKKQVIFSSVRDEGGVSSTHIGDDNSPNQGF